MPCLFCIHMAQAPCEFETCLIAADNDNRDPADRIIKIPSDSIFKRPSVYHRLAIVYKARGISRRQLAGRVNDMLWEFHGEAFDADDIYVELLLIDAHDLLWPDSDPHARWVSDFYSMADAMPMQATQDRVVPRLRLLWLALAIECPHLAASVIR
jgi:hypothetical protein